METRLVLRTKQIETEIIKDKDWLFGKLKMFIMSSINMQLK